MATGLGGMLWLIVRNLFAPEGVRLEVMARFKKMSDFTPAKPKDDIEVVTVKNDEELKAELAKGAK
jgi:predicted component of type VI protein secretion system